MQNSACLIWFTVILRIVVFQFRSATAHEPIQKSLCWLLSADIRSGPRTLPHMSLPMVLVQPRTSRDCKQRQLTCMQHAAGDLAVALARHAALQCTRGACVQKADVLTIKELISR